MPIDHDDIEPELSNAQEAFRRGGQTPEEGLDVSSADLVQLRKACRLLSGAERLFEDGYYTLTIEAAFTSLERTLLFWLITEGHHDPSQPPQSHTTAINRSAEVGFLTDEVATELENLWNEHRAHTYYHDGMATDKRANAMTALAAEIHSQIANLAGQSHECICE
jgi:HEPN domain-containing protein